MRAIRLKNGFNSRFVRVYTEEGLTGTGECVDSVGTEYIINNNFNAMLKGRDPLTSRASWRTSGAITKSIWAARRR